MKEKIQQLEILLKEISDLIKLHIEIEQIDLKESDEVDGSKEYMNNFRETIKSFYENDIPKIKLLLSDTLNQLPPAKNDLLNSRFKSNKTKPNNELIKLLEQGY